MRLFPAPWTVEPLDGGYKVVDANGQVLAYVYGIDDLRDARIAQSLTRDEARRVASNIAKLPTLLSKGEVRSPYSAARICRGQTPVTEGQHQRVI